MVNIIETAFKYSAVRKTTLASKMGISRARVTQMLSGQKNLTFKTISDFCKCCGFDLELKLKKINIREKITSVPDSLKWLFWDVDFSRLDPLQHKGYILPRILDRGDSAAVRWMRETYSKRQIFNFISRNRKKIDPRSLNFWALIYGKEEKWTARLPQPKTMSWQNL
jgi:DNA-binding Xre family transcriptional regulator